jgi:hypothetical protein
MAVGTFVAPDPSERGRHTQKWQHFLKGFMGLLEGLVIAQQMTGDGQQNVSMSMRGIFSGVLVIHCCITNYPKT